MKIVLVSFLICISYHLQSQSFYKYEKDHRWALISGIGINNYYGELNDSHKFYPRNFNISVGVEYPITSSINLRSEIMYYAISGSDKNAPLSGGRRERNLSFRSDNLEYTVTSVFNFFKEHLSKNQEKKVNFYLLAGVGFTYFNPKAKYEGNWYQLRPLKTEDVAYSRFAPVFPAGMGIKYKIDMNLALVMECTYRFSTTDYLDDVSTIYVNKNDVGDPIGAILADRRPEAGAEPARIGSPRGNPDTNDGYLAINFKLMYKIGEPKPVRRVQEK